MARILQIDGMNEEIKKSLARSFQSGHINFLIGSGASLPGIPAAGQLEQEIAALLAAGQDEQARLRMYAFLATIQQPTNHLISNEPNNNNDVTLASYSEFLRVVETILSERRTTLLPKQATIFTTNYDLFIEKASATCQSLKLNDGFSRVPSLNNRMEYSSRNFFNTTFNTGNVYSYKVEIPCINLVKLHGSLSWKKNNDEIVFDVNNKALLVDPPTPAQIKEYVESYAVVLPQATKFRTTLMDRTYYELLRIYANELDRENTLLLSFGFSFGDEHIRDITKRALKNPTLRLIVFAFSEADQNSYATIFERFNNVEIIAPTAATNINFAKFNESLHSFLPSVAGTK